MKKTSKIETLKALHCEIIESCERIVRGNTLTSHPFVVGRDGLYVKTLGLDENNATTGEHTMTTNPADAMGFIREDAELVASNMKNGNGHFEFYGRFDAAKQAIETHKGSIAFLDKIAAGS